MEETGCKVNCGASTTLAVKGLMIMMSTHYAVPINTPLSDFDSISRSQQCQTIFTENFMFSSDNV